MPITKENFCVPQLLSLYKAFIKSQIWKKIYIKNAQQNESQNNRNFNEIKFMYIDVYVSRIHEIN